MIKDQLFLVAEKIVRDSHQKKRNKHIALCKDQTNNEKEFNARNDFVEESIEKHYSSLKYFGNPTL